jgi:hypothetical protein
MEGVFQNYPSSLPLVDPRGGRREPDVSPVKGTAGPGASRPWHSWRGSASRRFGEAAQPTLAVSPPTRCHSSGFTGIAISTRDADQSAVHGPGSGDSRHGGGGAPSSRNVWLAGGALWWRRGAADHGIPSTCSLQAARGSKSFLWCQW